jgi:hypothetical protein
MAALCLMLASLTHGAEFLSSGDPAMSDMPFSEAVRSNGFLILSGQIWPRAASRVSRVR